MYEDARSVEHVKNSFFKNSMRMPWSMEWWNLIDLCCVKPNFQNLFENILILNQIKPYLYAFKTCIMLNLYAYENPHILLNHSFNLNWRVQQDAQTLRSYPPKHGITDWMWRDFPLTISILCAIRHKTF